MAHPSCGQVQTGHRDYHSKIFPLVESHTRDITFAPSAKNLEQISANHTSKLSIERIDKMRLFAIFWGNSIPAILEGAGSRVVTQ